MEYDDRDPRYRAHGRRERDDFDQRGFDQRGYDHGPDRGRYAGSAYSRQRDRGYSEIGYESLSEGPRPPTGCLSPS